MLGARPARSRGRSSCARSCGGNHPAHREQALGRIVRGHRVDPAGERRAVRRQRARGRRRLAPARAEPLRRCGQRGDLVLSIAPEQLVGALARERDGHVAAREPREQQKAEAGDVRHGLLEVPQRLVEEIRVVGRARGQLVMLGAEAVRDAARVLELVRPAVLGERDREGLDRAARGLGHQRGDQAGVKASAEHDPERDVGDHAGAHRLAHQPQQLLLMLLPARTGIGGASRRRESTTRAPRRPGRPRRPAARPAAACARPRTGCAGRARSRARGTARRRIGSSSGWMTPPAISDLTSDAKARPFGVSAQYSGLTPIRSRASTSRRRGLSQSAMANMPRRRVTKSGPNSS